MYSNMLMALVEHGRIQTTDRKAKALRSLAERMVTRATRLGDILLKEPDSLSQEDRAAKVHAMRTVRRTLRDRDSVVRLFEEWAPRYLGRPGGYTRIMKVGFRRGDAAPVSIVEFIDAEMPEKEGDAPDDDAKKKGILDRIRRKEA